ncbi:MAG: adenylyltransferase/cytidyltransferase family protein [Elusimicrobia bacterium]|nr:adenylyltransferase/cytidyltransferase family protein [Elusimicrobiota bacterium]MBI4218396.1 adenylyltransferase/cytidyltransferase family protein [Elusimicrobiota bacterium]
MKKNYNRTVLSKILNKARGKKKIVFTNGCYDLLHVGHVRLLHKAKQCGDILVVGVNSDRSVKALKGPSRPYVGEKDRVEILAALSAVDYVTTFSEKTPEKTIALLKPDILMKGADYRVDQIAGKDLVGKVVRFPLVKGQSTTQLARKIARVQG